VRDGVCKADVLALRPALIKQGVFDDGINSSQAPIELSPESFRELRMSKYLDRARVNSVAASAPFELGARPAKRFMHGSCVPIRVVIGNRCCPLRPHTARWLKRGERPFGRATSDWARHLEDGAIDLDSGPSKALVLCSDYGRRSRSSEPTVVDNPETNRVGRWGIGTGIGWANH